MIRRTVAALWALAILAWAAPALAQVPNLPPGTVLGRLNISPGPAQAIPFATLATSMGFGALSTLSIGTGLTTCGTALCMANQIASGGPAGTATVVPILTWNAQGQLTVVSSATITPAFSSITGTPTTLAGYGIASPLPVAQGGSGAGTLTNHTILLGQGTSAVASVAAMTDGQLVVGQTGADPLPKTSSGAVTLAASGAFAFANLQCGGAAITTTGSCPMPSVATRFGGFDVWQRLVNAATTITQAASLTAYVNDGWYLVTGANQAATVTQVAGIATGSQFAAKVQRNSGQTGTGVMRYAAPLFLDEIALLRGYNVAVSCTLADGANQSFSHAVGISLYAGTGAAAKRAATPYTSETLVINTTLTTSSTPTRFTLVSAAVIPTSTTQMEFQFSIGPTGTAGTDDSVTVDDCNIEVVAASTSVASPFPRWSYGDQLDRARSVFRILAGGVLNSRIYVGLTESTSIIAIGGPLSPPMKLGASGAVPAPSFVGTAANIHCNDLSVNSAFQGTFGTNYSTQYTYGFQLNCAATLTAGKAGFLNFDGSAAEALFLSSEL